ncbi:MAG: hypothetical protein JEZ00_18570 [Anaerolineaceae bacterium]|nr:hypothetical protein [Anaerolineaceae bacterium]
MLINALLILLTEILLILCGMAVLRLLHLVLPNFLPQIDTIPLSMLAILGLIGSTFLAAIASLFMRINWEFQSFLLIGIILYTILDRRWILTRIQKLSKISWRLDFYLLVLFGLITALVLATSADPDRSYDDGLYHLQSVLLITKGAAIPGIGLLHNRFAYNAIWHVTSALWGYQFFHPQQMVYFISTPILMLNFLLSLFYYYRTEKNRYMQWSSLLLLIVGITYMVYYRYDFGAVDNNLPSFILTWLTILMFLQIAFRFTDVDAKNQESILFLIFCVFAWTVKISTIMLIIPALYLLNLLWKNKQSEAITASIVSLTLLIPWMGRSLITSGFFIYPPFAKWFGIPFKWQMPYAMAEENKLVDISWAKIPGTSSQAVSEMSLLEWAPQWFQLLDRNEKLLIAATILIVFFSVLSILFKRKELIETNKLIPSIVFSFWMAASIIFWFFTYPDPRFFYGPAISIIASGMLSFALWIPVRYRVNYPMLTRSSVTTTIVVIVFIFVRLNILSEINYRYIKIHPAEIPQIEIRQVDLNDFTLNLPVSGNQCWGNAIPCAPDKCSESVYLMGETIFDGLMFIEPNP